MNKVAIMIDGDFFIRRMRALDFDRASNPASMANTIRAIARLHASKAKREIYRIFFYDCEPMKGRLHNPITNACIDFSKSDLHAFRTALHNELRASRKTALRLGTLRRDADNAWIIKPEKGMGLLKGRLKIEDLDPEKDIIPNVRQKEVDMKIGIDIATLSLKKQVDTIVLIAGDCDFVPAAKLARREGIDFILDAMRRPIDPRLHEHIDGLRSVIKQKATSSPKETK